MRAVVAPVAFDTSANPFSVLIVGKAAGVYQVTADEDVTWSVVSGAGAQSTPLAAGAVHSVWLGAGDELFVTGTGTAGTASAWLLWPDEV